MSAIRENTIARRIVSIDALRGFDMFWITGGAGLFLSLFQLLNHPFFNSLSHQLSHSKWNGFTFWDLIFPLFLFIVGASMPFSISKRLQRGDSRRMLYVHIVKRTLVLFILGLIYNGLLDFDFSEYRFAGVLQRISLCYFFTALIVMNTRIKGQVVFFLSILVSYWAIVTLIPVPGFGAGMLTPEGNLAAYIDQRVLPGKFCCYTFGDNEGILSTLPAISTTLLGVLSGHWIRSSFSQTKKVFGLLVAGIGCLGLGLIWNVVFPINKLIWTSSYVLYAGGWSLLLLCLFYWIIDVKSWKKWTFPFIVIGLNPITIYVAQSLFDFGIIANIFVHGFIDELGLLKPVFWSLCVLMVKWLSLFFLYKQKIFLRA